MPTATFVTFFYCCVFRLVLLLLLCCWQKDVVGFPFYLLFYSSFGFFWHFLPANFIIFNSVKKCLYYSRTTQWHNKCPCTSMIWQTTSRIVDFCFDIWLLLLVFGLLLFLLQLLLLYSKAAKVVDICYRKRISSKEARVGISIALQLWLCLLVVLLLLLL